MSRSSSGVPSASTSLAFELELVPSPAIPNSPLTAARVSIFSESTSAPPVEASTNDGGRGRVIPAEGDEVVEREGKEGRSVVAPLLSMPM